LHKLPDTGRRRVMIEFDPQDAEVAELRVHLTVDGERSSETWLSRWTQ
jgi:glucan biosynthesis protein